MQHSTKYHKITQNNTQLTKLRKIAQTESRIQHPEYGAWNMESASKGSHERKPRNKDGE